MHPAMEVRMLKKLSAFAAPALLTVIATLQALAQATPSAEPRYYWPGPWHMWSDGAWWPHFWFGPFMMLAFAVLCIGMMVFMMRGMHRHRGGDAVEILKERFARGEITQTEYEDRRRLLEA